MSPLYVVILDPFRGLIHLQQFRRRDPTDADEAEFMENVFDSLCSALAEAEIKDLLLKSEGVDLMVLMMKYASHFCFSLESALTSPLSETRCKHAHVQSKPWTMQCPGMQVRSRARYSSRHRDSSTCSTL